MNNKFSSFAEVFNGKTPSRVEQRESGHPVLKIKDVNEFGKFAGKFNSFVDLELATTFKDKLIMEGDILILNAAHNADYVGSKIYKAEKEVIGALPTGEWLVIRPKHQQLNSSFAYQWVLSGRTRLKFRNLVKGIHLYPKDVRQISVSFPLFYEQGIIAAILDKADALREKRRLALQKLDTLLQSVFLEMFGDPVKNPKGWDVVPFVESVSNTRLGLVRAAHEFGKNFEVPYVRMNSITRTGNLDLTTVLKTTASTKEIRDNRLEKGDFLFNTRNSKELVGKTAIFDGEGDYVFNNNIMRIRFNDSFDPYFIHSLFQTNKIQYELEIRKAGTTNVFAIYYKNLQTVPLMKPPSEIQKKFGQITQKIRRQKTVFESNLEKVENLFQSLQQRAFKGELFNDEFSAVEPQGEKVWQQTSLF